MNQLEKRLYNSRIIDTYIRLVQKHYQYVDIGELLAYAGMHSYQVADQWHWFTQEQIDRFHEKLVQLTGNYAIAHEAGRYAASPDALGVMRKYTLSFFSPDYIFERLEQTTAHFTKSSVYHTKKLAPNRFEVSVVPNPGSEEKPFQCQNRIGFFEAIVTMFNYNLPTIEHHECLFDGGQACRYTISWKKTPASFLRRTTNLFTLLSFLAVAVLLATGLYRTLPTAVLLTTLAIIGSILLTLTVTTDKIEKRILKSSLDNIKDTTDQLISRINTDYSNALMTNEIGQVISRQTNTVDIVNNVIEILEQRLDYDRGMILLANRDKSRLLFKAAFGYRNNELKLIRRYPLLLNHAGTDDIFGSAFHSRSPLLINDISTNARDLGPRSRRLAEKLGAHAFICCPIIADNESLGVLTVDNPRSKRPMIQSDISLLMGITPMIGISIRNAELIEAREKQFQSVIQVLASSTDARDPLTAGHSERVTEFATGICREMNLGDEFCDIIKVAALLHDYGKIGIPDTILKKNGRLTDEEFEIVKTHAGKTREILEKANFEGSFRQIPEIAGSHHEKLDGSGYPAGLTDGDIPIGARIIAVADFFEALTSKRHYRDPLPVDEVLCMLREKSGLHYDPQVVEALTRYHSKTI
ncbi:MAG: phosphohydrolase [Desulfuromonadaceae bacterium GWC2_58_13]|nr:MAG: phosphohydrolase [Desulfuromonadaceae bacterium GWC2_58_13]